MHSSRKVGSKEEKQNNQSLFSRVKGGIVFGVEIGGEVLKAMIRHPVSYFTGSRIFSDVPHYSGGILGCTTFNANLTDALTAEALKARGGLVTYWAGPFLPVLYVVSNADRLAIVKESHLGSINNESASYLSWLTRENNVMANFLAFMQVDSPSYKAQREFLMKFFHAGVKYRLPGIDKATKDYLCKYSEENTDKPRSLREFITLLVLYVSSHTLGLTKCTLNELYLENQDFCEAIDEVALYGISEKGNALLEEKLYRLFYKIIEKNFDSISANKEDECFIKCIFRSVNLSFPKKFEDFKALQYEIRNKLAYLFVSTAIGGFVHSTVNTLDWALARLLNNQKQFNLILQQVEKYSEGDFSQEAIFEKGGDLFELSKWVLHNVFLYPPFSHQFFYNSKAYDVKLPNDSKLTIPAGMMVVVNYQKCNELQKDMKDEKGFASELSSQATVGRFVSNKKVASFGGSAIDKDNKVSRVCPGAKTALNGQMVMLANLISGYKVMLENSISCVVDRRAHPLCTRLNQGKILLVKRSALLVSEQKHLRPS